MINKRGVMSVGIDIDEKLWEQYLSFCRSMNTPPDMSGFGVWKSDMDIDEDETERE